MSKLTFKKHLVPVSGPGSKNGFRGAQVMIGADAFHSMTGRKVPKGKTCTITCPPDMSDAEIGKNLKVGAFTTLETQRVLFVSIDSAA